MTRAADRLGLLVWSEIPVYWTIAWSNVSTLATARAQLGEEIARDRQPRVGDPVVGRQRDAGLRGAQPASCARWSTTCAPPTTRALSRPRSSTAPSTRARTCIDDPLGVALDVLGLNEYVGWYDGLPAKCDTLAWRSAYDKPIIVSEFGADAKAGLHGDALTRFSEDTRPTSTAVRSPC